MPRETVAEREERLRQEAEKEAAYRKDQERRDSERRAANARASRAGVEHLDDDASEEDLVKADKAVKEAAAGEPPQTIIPPDATYSYPDPEKDVYEDYEGGEELKAKGVTPLTKEALETVVIKSNTVAVNPLPRPDNEVKNEDGSQKYQARDVITQNGITVMTLDKSTYRAPGGVEEWLPIGTIIQNFKGVLSKVHAVISEEATPKVERKKT